MMSLTKRWLDELIEQGAAAAQTAGPWLIVEDNLGNLSILYMGEACEGDRLDLVAESLWGNNAANARLIAAAPLLLAAARSAHDWILSQAQGSEVVAAQLAQAIEKVTHAEIILW